ncbi:hypothetical protein E2P81_ATG08244 [Venturia nashicola]|nr:hypothetical protein E2P81_ATG08244 [Venturia nashicola]
MGQTTTGQDGSNHHASEMGQSTTRQRWVKLEGGQPESESESDFRVTTNVDLSDVGAGRPRSPDRRAEVKRGDWRV